MSPCTIGGVLTTTCHFMQSCPSTYQLGISDEKIDEVPQRAQGGNADRVEHTKLGSWDPCLACFLGKGFLDDSTKRTSEITECEQWEKRRAIKVEIVFLPQGWNDETQQMDIPMQITSIEACHGSTTLRTPDGLIFDTNSIQFFESISFEC